MAAKTWRIARRAAGALAAWLACGACVAAVLVSEGDALIEPDYLEPSASRSFDTAPLPDPAGSVEPAAFKGMLAAHNRWRALVGAPPLQWSPTAAAMAQGWAEQLATESCAMRHNPAPERKQRFGENIYRYWRTSPYEGWKREPDYVVKAWGDEIAWYDVKDNSCGAPEGASCGHFTQLMWSHSRVVGCGRMHCGTSEVWVCNYYPRGNYVGMRPFGLGNLFAATPPAEQGSGESVDVMEVDHAAPALPVKAAVLETPAPPAPPAPAAASDEIPDLVTPLEEPAAGATGTGSH